MKTGLFYFQKMSFNTVHIDKLNLAKNLVTLSITNGDPEASKLELLSFFYED
jgi:hypothetical protein